MHPQKEAALLGGRRAAFSSRAAGAHGRQGSGEETDVGSLPPPWCGSLGFAGPGWSSLVTGARAVPDHRGRPGKGTPVTCWLSTWAIAQTIRVKGQDAESRGAGLQAEGSAAVGFRGKRRWRRLQTDRQNLCLGLAGSLLAPTYGVLSVTV